ncbi:GH25 family lysozyme [Staphylococcus nepalensis]|jgi:GH25 family lysozyme M1 (1,4-beta-N-acetylmuramidase)|uniref:14-beta-N-acetylmuramidase n=2 Tax=Staphylococcus TaxID=1279 RepID=A0A291JNN0_9STAP|nr:lysozyme [Staphylococcus nepalensis]NWN85720.1 lysozyme [Staphylococcus sp.]VDG68213.1 glycosyl hydrolase [Lacrimispora indolis]ATH66211.1 lysozyme [Staphylococcus nepalensis]AWI45599.1 lysozyme [Staphylococcus nepalensis]
MSSIIRKGFLSISILFATTMTLNAAHAAEDTANQKGTMGYGYQKYLDEHPEKAQKEKPESSFRSEAGTTAAGERVLDISEWQGDLTAQQVKDLKSNYDFIIIRAQYGSEKVDATLEHNSNLLDKYNLDFGVYSYSMYENPEDARYEAQTLYNRAPKASFYINDFEENTVTSGTTEESTSAWYDEMRSLAGDKKILFYSYENFMKEHASESVGQYDGYWIANYNPGQPTQEHVLWQYTDSYASPELNQNVDANYTGPGVDTSWFTS